MAGSGSINKRAARECDAAHIILRHGCVVSGSGGQQSFHPRSANSVCGRAIDGKGIHMKKVVLLIATIATLAAVAAPPEARVLHRLAGAGAAIDAAQSDPPR